MEAELGGHMLLRLHPEVNVAHPSLQRAERVLDRGPPHAHGVGVAVKPVLHALQNVLVLPPDDTTLLAGRTACLERA